MLVDARHGSGSLSIAASATEQRFYLIPFSAPETTSDSAYSFNLKFDVKEQAPPAAAKLSSSMLAKEDLLAPILSPHLKRVQAEMTRRQQDTTQITEALSKQKAAPELFTRFYSRTPRLISREAVPTPTLQIYSPFEGELGTQITGILRAQSSTAAIYVDSRVNDSVDQTAVDAMMQGYDGVSLPRLHTLYGKESDVDGNGRINIFLADPAKVGANVIGFFRPSDLLPDGTVSGVRSNQMEIVYVRIPGADFDFGLGQATVAHETFHLIQFATKSLPIFRGTGGFAGMVESLFLNEGEAHLAEDLTGWGVGTAEVAEIYLNCIGQTSLGGGASPNADTGCQVVAAGDDSLARRGGMMLLLLYMFQQDGGATYSDKTVGDIQGNGIQFLRRLITSPAVGIKNLEQASNRSFFAWYADFVATLALDNTNITDNPRFAFQPEVKDSFTGFLRNLRMHSVRVGSSGTVTLGGPKVSKESTASSDLTIGESLLVTGADVIHLTVPANLETTFSLTGDRLLALGMAVIPAQ